LQSYAAMGPDLSALNKVAFYSFFCRLFPFHLSMSAPLVLWIVLALKPSLIHMNISFLWIKIRLPRTVPGYNQY
jgi:hypothetical protein